MRWRTCRKIWKDLLPGRRPGSRSFIPDEKAENKSMTGVRMDKWLWAARFFKTRALATKACELGKVESHNQFVKPAREVKVGDMLRIKTEVSDFQVEVLQLSEIRGPAAVAQTLYRETEESRELRHKAREERK